MTSHMLHSIGVFTSSYLICDAGSYLMLVLGGHDQLHQSDLHPQLHRGAGKRRLKMEVAGNNCTLVGFVLNPNYFPLDGLLLWIFSVCH